MEIHGAGWHRGRADGVPLAMFVTPFPFFANVLVLRLVQGLVHGRCAADSRAWGAQQLVNALPLSGGTDRNRLVAVLGKAAAEKTGSIVFLSHNNEKWLLMEWLTRAGVSRLGAQQTVNVMPILDYRDRTRIAALVAMCQVNGLEHEDSWSEQI